MNIDIMLKRLGELASFKLLTKTITDSFYDEYTTVETDYECYAVVVPARAYDIHSNIFYRPETTGFEEFGIISIFIAADDYEYINEEDYYLNGSDRYKIISSEKWSDEYYLLEGHYEDSAGSD